MTNAESADSTPFDFARHRRQAVEEYQPLRPLYEQFADAVRGILRNAIDSERLKVASIDARAKSVSSFAEKAATPAGEDANQPKYEQPLHGITDLAGIRVITFFPGVVRAVERIVAEQFTVLERSDKGDVLRAQDRFGYQSVHYLVSLRPNRLGLPEYAKFRDLVAEIQVRTILQHAWAEIEHDIQYKSEEAIPIALRRRFTALAGMFELADREFEALQQEDEALRQAARSSVQAGQLGGVEITPDALRVYLNRRLGPDGRMTSWSYEWAATLLRRLGFETLERVDQAIAPYDDDRIARIVWGSRMGQMARFEAMLLAALGDEYVRTHPWRGEEWFKSAHQRRLERLREAGIATSTFTLQGDSAVTKGNK